jgi:hypothetical protein
VHRCSYPPGAVAPRGGTVAWRELSSLYAGRLPQTGRSLSISESRFLKAEFPSGRVTGHLRTMSNLRRVPPTPPGRVHLRQRAKRLQPPQQRRDRQVKRSRTRTVLQVYGVGPFHENERWPTRPN